MVGVEGRVVVAVFVIAVCHVMSSRVESSRVESSRVESVSRPALFLPGKSLLDLFGKILS
jgi:hypothetical protein